MAKTQKNGIGFHYSKNMLTRKLSQTIKTISNRFPVLMVTGPRQVGKTTLLEMCSEGERAYVIAR